MKKFVFSILSALAGMFAGAVAVRKMASEKITRTKSMSDKHLELFKVMTQWVQVKQEGKNLASYLEENGYKTIAIYGMSYAGETLVYELKDSGITVVYGIDNNSDFIFSDMKIVTMEDDLEKVDAIVVTAITFFDEIEKALSEKTDCPVISLEEILYEV